MFSNEWKKKWSGTRNESKAFLAMTSQVVNKKRKWKCHRHRTHNVSSISFQHSAFVQAVGLVATKKLNMFTNVRSSTHEIILDFRLFFNARDRKKKLLD